MQASLSQSTSGNIMLGIVAGVLLVVGLVIMLLAYNRSTPPAKNTEVQIDPYELEDYRQVQPF